MFSLSQTNWALFSSKVFYDLGKEGTLIYNECWIPDKLIELNENFNKKIFPFILSYRINLDKYYNESFFISNNDNYKNSSESITFVGLPMIQEGLFLNNSKNNCYYIPKLIEFAVKATVTFIWIFYSFVIYHAFYTKAIQAIVNNLT